MDLYDIMTEVVANIDRDGSEHTLNASRVVKVNARSKVVTDISKAE